MDNNRESLRAEDHKEASFFEIGFIDEADLLTFLDVRSLGQILLKLSSPSGLLILTSTINYCFTFLQVATEFTKNIYFYSFVIGFFFERKFIILMLFLFPVSTLFTHGTVQSPSENFFQCLLILSLVCLLVLFLFVQRLPRALFLFTLVQWFRKLILYKWLFVDFLCYNVTKLLKLYLYYIYIIIFIIVLYLIIFYFFEEVVQGSSRSSQVQGVRFFIRLFQQ